MAMVLEQNVQISMMFGCHFRNFMESVGDVLAILSVVASMFDQYDQYFYWNHYSTDYAHGTLRTQKITAIITIHIRSTGCTRLTTVTGFISCWLLKKIWLTRHPACHTHTSLLFFYVLACAICPNRISFHFKHICSTSCLSEMIGGKHVFCCGISQLWRL